MVALRFLTNSVGVHPRNIYTKYEENPCSSLGEVKKVYEGNDDDRHRVITRDTLTHLVLLKSCAISVVEWFTRASMWPEFGHLFCHDAHDTNNLAEKYQN